MVRASAPPKARCPLDPGFLVPVMTTFSWRQAHSLQNRLNIRPWTRICARGYPQAGPTYKTYALSLHTVQVQLNARLEVNDTVLVPFALRTRKYSPVLYPYGLGACAPRGSCGKFVTERTQKSKNGGLLPYRAEYDRIPGSLDSFWARFCEQSCRVQIQPYAKPSCI